MLIMLMRFMRAFKLELRSVFLTVALSLCASAGEPPIIKTQNGATPSDTGWNLTSFGSVDVNGSVVDPDFNQPVWEISDVDGSGRARWELDAADLVGFGPGTDFRLRARVRVIGANRSASAGTLLEVADGNERYVFTLGKLRSTTLYNFLESSISDEFVQSEEGAGTEYLNIELLRVDGVVVLLVNDVLSRRVPHAISTDSLLRVNFGDGARSQIGGMYVSSVSFEWGEFVLPCAVSLMDGTIDQAFIDAFPNNITAECPQQTIVTQALALDSVASLDGLGSVDTIIGGVLFTGHAPQGTVVGWPALKQINGGLNFFSVANLRTISGFENLQSIGDVMVAFGNPDLESIAGFSNLASVGDEFFVFDNAQLRSITGFQNLAMVRGLYRVVNNPVLTDVSGFSSLVSVSEDFVVSGNSSLANCEVFSFLIDAEDDAEPGPAEGHPQPDVGLSVQLSSNRDGCNAISEILRDADGDGIQDHRDAFPNDFDNDGADDDVDSFPTDPSETQDSDGDGIGDNREAQLGTDPLRADSDGDGFTDPEELDLGSNPADGADFPSALGLPIPLLKAAKDASS